MLFTKPIILVLADIKKLSVSVSLSIEKKIENIGDYRYRPQWKKAFRSYPNYIGSRVTYSRECKRSRIYTHFYNSVEKVLMQIITRVLCEDGSATWWDWVLRKSRICSFGLKVAKVPYYYCALKALSIFACSMNLD